MVKMINRATGTTMWVASGRVDEYKALGHKVAVEKSEKKAAPKKRKAQQPETEEEKGTENE